MIRDECVFRPLRHLFDDLGRVEMRLSVTSCTYLESFNALIHDAVRKLTSTTY
jgi:hypothetical protein